MENSLLSNVEVSLNENPLDLVETEIMQPKGGRKNQQLRTQQIPVPINVGLMSVKSEPAYDFFLAPEALEHIIVDVVVESGSTICPLEPCSDDFSPPKTFEHLTVPSALLERSEDVVDSAVNLEIGSDGSTLEAHFSVGSTPVHLTSASLPSSSSSVSCSQNNAKMVQVGNTPNSSEAVASKEIVSSNDGTVENENPFLDSDSGASGASEVNNIDEKIAELQRQLNAALAEKRSFERKKGPGPSKRKRVDNHTEEQSFPCSFKDCNYVGQNARYLKLHLETHSEEKSLCCTEPDCTYKTKTTTALRKHKASHKHREQFKCKLCSSTFSSNDAVRVHIRIHTKEKPFKCPEPNCTYAGSQKVHLDTHKTLKHPE